MFGIFHHLNINHVVVVQVEDTSWGKARVKSSFPFTCKKEFSSRQQKKLKHSGDY